MTPSFESLLQKAHLFIVIFKNNLLENSKNIDECLDYYINSLLNLTDDELKLELVITNLKRNYEVFNEENFKKLKIIACSMIDLIKEVLNKYPHELSGGQRQAIALLMATMKAPQLILLDEHTAALDPKTQKKIMTLSEEKIKEKNLTALMITHNLQDALTYGNRMLLLHQGEIIRDFSEEEKKKLSVTDLYKIMVELDEKDN